MSPLTNIRVFFFWGSSLAYRCSHQTSHKCSCSHLLQICDSNRNNKLSIFTVLSQWPLVQAG